MLSPAFANMPLCCAHKTGVTSSAAFDPSCIANGAVCASAGCSAARATASAASDAAKLRRRTFRMRGIDDAFPVQLPHIEIHTARLDDLVFHL